MFGKPILIPDPTVLLRLKGNAPLFIGGIWGSVRQGQTVLAADGQRFVWFCDGTSLVYSQENKFFTQAGGGFVNDVRTAPDEIAGRRSLEFVKALSEVEMKLLLGLVAGSSGLGFALVIGSEVGEFAIRNRNNFSNWIAQLSAILQARQVLKRVAPTIYEKLFNSVLHQVWQGVRSNLPDAVTPEVVAFALGVIIGTVGKKIATGRFTWFALIFVVFEQILIRFTLSVLPGALILTATEYRRMADELVRKLRESGVNISEPDARRILEEAQKHPEEVKKAFDLMKKGFAH